MLVSGRRRCIASIERPIVPRPSRAIRWGYSVAMAFGFWRDWGCRRMVKKGRDRKRELGSYRWSRRCSPISGEWRGHAGSGGPRGYCTIVRCMPLNIGLHYMIVIAN